MSVAHQGKITSISNRVIHVNILSVSACSTCSAKRICNLSEMKNKQIHIPEPLQHTFQTGDNVLVEIEESNGIQAVILSYILPAVILFASIIGAILFSFSETMSALIGIGCTAIYFGFIYLLRKKINKKFIFSIRKEDT